MSIAFHELDQTDSVPELLSQLAPEQRDRWYQIRNSVKAVSLDLWGTILDDAHAPSDTVLYSKQRQEYFGEVLQDRGFDATADQIQQAYKHTWHYFDDLWAQQKSFTAADGVQEMLQFLNVSLPPSNVEEIVRYFEEFRKERQLLPGAQSAVKRLGLQYPLVLISDTAWTPGRVLTRLLEEFELAKYFQAMVYSGEIGFTKPHPVIFQRALDHFGIPASQCLHAGDLQRTDIVGAKEAGMYSAWIYRPVYAGAKQSDHSPDLIVKDLSQLADLLTAETAIR